VLRIGAEFGGVCCGPAGPEHEISRTDEWRDLSRVTYDAASDFASLRSGGAVRPEFQSYLSLLHDTGWICRIDPLLGGRAGKGSDLINPTAERNLLSSKQYTGRCLVGQLADGLDDLAPCYQAVVIVTRGELDTRFSIRGGGAPDVDLGYQGSPARDKLIGMTAARRR
jgi:hypothetical protein